MWTPLDGFLDKMERYNQEQRAAGLMPERIEPNEYDTLRSRIIEIEEALLLDPGDKKLRRELSKQLDNFSAYLKKVGR